MNFNEIRQLLTPAYSAPWDGPTPQDAAIYFRKIVDLANEAHSRDLQVQNAKVICGLFIRIIEEYNFGKNKTHVNELLQPFFHALVTGQHDDLQAHYEQFRSIIAGKSHSQCLFEAAPIEYTINTNELQKCGRAVALDQPFRSYLLDKDFAEAHAFFAEAGCFKESSLRALKQHIIGNTAKEALKSFFSWLSALMSDPYINIEDFFHAHIGLKFFASVYGRNPDVEQIKGLYGVIEKKAFEILSIAQNRQIENAKVLRTLLQTEQKDLDSYTFVFDEHFRTCLFGFASMLPPVCLPAEELSALIPDPEKPSWIAKKWKKLTSLQRSHVKEVYQDYLTDRPYDKKSGGAYRLRRDLYAYRALENQDDLLPQFKNYLKEQLHHLLSHPDLLDSLHDSECRETEVPMVLLRQAKRAGHVWIHGHTALMRDSIVVGMKSETNPTLKEWMHDILEHEPLTTDMGEVNSEQINKLFERVKETRQRIIVVTENVTLSTKKPTGPRKSQSLEPPKKRAKVVGVKPCDEPPLHQEEHQGASAQSHPRDSELSIEKPELLAPTLGFTTGDYLIDQALLALFMAQQGLDNTIERKATPDASTRWPEARLKKRVAQLPVQPEPHKPLLSFKLKPYQIKAVQKSRMWLKNGLAGLIACDAGLGKTLICLNHIFQELAEKSFSDKPVVVVCPKMLVTQWHEAFCSELSATQAHSQTVIRSIPIDRWRRKLQEQQWIAKITSHATQTHIQTTMNQLSVDEEFYETLEMFLYHLALHAGNEGREALIELLRGYPGDIRHIVLSAFDPETALWQAENAEMLQQGIQKKAKVLITTASSLLKLEDGENARYSWLILDEADRLITNKKYGGEDARLRTLFEKWPDQKRLLVTATPIRNSITDLWKLLELVHGEDHEGRIFFNQLLLVKDAFMNMLRDIALEKEVSMDELYEKLEMLHHRITYLREIVTPLTYVAKRSDPVIRNEWNGAIPTVRHEVVPVELTQKQKALLEGALKANKLFTLYDNESKVKQHPDLLQPGTHKLIENDSHAFRQLVLRVQRDPDSVLRDSPVWQALMDKLATRIAAQQKCLIVCHHITPQEILKELIKTRFSQQNVLVELLNGNTESSARKRILDRFKEEQRRPSVLLLINKSGGAGLDFKDAKTMFFLGEQWNDGSREQEESRHIRVGVDGEKEVIYFHANLQHERHMRDTSAKKKLWSEIALTKRPTEDELVDDVRKLLDALIAELAAIVKDGKQLNEGQRALLDEYKEQLLRKVAQKKSQFCKEYELYAPQSWPYLLQDTQNSLRLLELPIRGSKELATAAGLYIIRNGISQEVLNSLNSAALQKKQITPPAHFLEMRTEGDVSGIETVIYTVDGYSTIEKPCPAKRRTLRLLTLGNNYYSVLISLK
ncbi:MAG: DEAD/DEAH box helicase [Verrucomicrobia bacterium]|nr:DEAD/DEAH box helicase [Verrucomicrobiota bacterium]MBS0637310.1 DEAD/DEAH box helicase [Verrucomicrobiota bacterium]